MQLLEQHVMADDCEESTCTRKLTPLVPPNEPNNRTSASDVNHQLATTVRTKTPKLSFTGGAADGERKRGDDDFFGSGTPKK